MLDELSDEPFEDIQYDIYYGMVEMHVTRVPLRSFVSRGDRSANVEAEAASLLPGGDAGQQPIQE